MEKKKTFVDCINDEIGGDVYFYHNRISDKVDYFIVGCEVSQWDGDKIVSLLNFNEINNGNGCIVFNTCTVTEPAKIACERIAKRLNSVYPERQIFFTGCGVNYNKAFYKQYGTALTNEEKFDVTKYGCTSKNHNWSLKTIASRDAGMVKIEDGCKNNCAYCVVHKVRPHYMVPYEKIKEQIRTILNQDIKNIQLVGTEITSYNYNDLTLTELCKRILKDFPEIEILTLGFLDPASNEIDKLIELIKNEPRIYNTLCLCTQSCSDTILKSMRRRHDSNRLRELQILADNKVNFIYQLIIGFPGETDELFQETLDFVKELKPINIDTFFFSPRENTDAYNYPNQISKEVMAKRETALYEAVKEYSAKKFNFGKNEDELKRNIKNFIDFKVDNFKDYNVLYIKNIYGTETFKQVFDMLSKTQNLDNTILYTWLNPNKDIFDYDVNIKLLIALFGIKVVTNITLDDSLISSIVRGRYTLENIAYRFCTFLDLDFIKLENTNKEDLLAIFKNILVYNLYDINLLLGKLYKAGNKEYYNYIKNELNIDI